MQQRKPSSSVLSPRVIRISVAVICSILVLTVLYFQSSSHSLKKSKSSNKSKKSPQQTHHQSLYEGENPEEDNKKNENENNNNHGNENGEIKAEIGNPLFEEKIHYVSEVCEKAVEVKIIRHLLNTGGDGRNRNSFMHNSVGGNKKNAADNANSNPLMTKRRKILYFIGDSHALRTFRWASAFLRLANFLHPSSAEFVDESMLYNMDTGVFHEKKKLVMRLIPNPARLYSIEFRRAAFIDNVAAVIDDISKSVVRREKNFEAVVYFSAGSWDILRPTVSLQGYTFDTLFPKVEENQKNQHEIGHKLIEEEEAEAAFQKSVSPRWRESCTALDTALVNAFGWGEDVEEDHHLRRQVTNQGVFSRVSWRWPGPPNCETPRFQTPRASPALEAACPIVADKWWANFKTMASQFVRPRDRKPNNRGANEDHGNNPKFDFVMERSKWQECGEKKDGVHPSHLCVAREAGSYLMRVLSQS